MTVINFGTKKQLQSAHSIEGIDSSSLGVHHFPPDTIVFHPNEIQEIETEIIAMQTLQDNKVIVLEEFIQDSEKREPQQYLKSKVIETFQEIGKIFIIALFVFFLSRQIIQNYVVDGVSMEPTLFSNDYLIDIETGLYFGKKNSFIENQNIFISGLTSKEDQTVCWRIEKI